MRGNPAFVMGSGNVQGSNIRKVQLWGKKSVFGKNMKQYSPMGTFLKLKPTPTKIVKINFVY